VPTFAEAVRTAALNTVTKPVKSQFGYHLIIVTKRERVKASTLPKESRSEAIGQALQTSVANRAKNLFVNPAIGTVGFEPPNPFPRILAPKSSTIARDPSDAASNQAPAGQ
jgi:PPIC-type PPIASE domain